ncbi:MAG: arsenate reductase [Acidobacteria bacterium]|nr:arsenate reductase [Acidobacteriota bacterium]
MATLFRENGIDWDKVNYFNEPFTVENLTTLVKKTGVRPIKLTRGAAAAGLTDDSADADVIAAMVADPNLIQRPIVEVGDKAVLARPVERALELIGKI